MNIIATRTTTAFTINLQDWYYEGQIVDIIDDKLGSLKNVLIESINEINQTFIISADGKRYNVSMTSINAISTVNRRKIAV